MSLSKVARLAVVGITALAAQAAFAANPTFTFTDIATQLNVVDAAAINIVPSIFTGPPTPAAPGTGLVTLSTSNLLNKNGVLKGHQVATCVSISMNASVDTEAPGEIKTCNQTMTITGVGQLILSGTINRTAGEGGAKQTLAIVGGTGAFLAARGQVVTYDVPGNPMAHMFEVYLLPF